MPTIYHRTRFQMVGTLSLCPPYEFVLRSFVARMSDIRGMVLELQ